MSEATTPDTNDTFQTEGENAEKQIRNATEYVVLQDISDGKEEDWHLCGRFFALTPKDAIEQNGVSDKGTYVAVPARSWKPLTASKQVIEKITLQ